MINLENPNLDIVELERAVLGILLSNDHGLRDGIGLLGRAGDAIFTQHPHRAIFRAVQALYAEGLHVDHLSVNHRLVASGQMQAVRGKVSVTDLYAAAPRGQNITTYCHFLLRLHAKRLTVEIGQRLSYEAAKPDADVHELLAKAQASLGAVHNGLELKRPKAVAELYDEVVDTIVFATQQPEGLTGVTSGLRTVDKITGGWQPGDLVIIAARPGMGKTTWALYMAREAAFAGKPGVFFSLEMEDKQLVRKMITTELGVYTTSQLQRGVNLTTDEAESIRERAGRLRKAPLFIDETPALSIGELRAKAARLKAEHDIQFIVIDYLQLMTGTPGQTRTVEIGSITRALKQTAKELGVPILALAQLSRATEQRGGDKKPQLSDLRESGDIEQDADIVVFPYRPDYYGIKEDDMGNPTTDLSYIIFGKHRNGPLDEVVIGSTLPNGRYFDIDTVVPVVTPAGSLSSEVRPVLRTATPSEFMPDETDPGF
ncbi:replicative DNA helicase [Hymenobacter sp. AT01-02]|uniref:replicative DNA helicase n=1 Tax=Hymenobacter sp. AT01-02 TaxID=1571877 RepID=UPI0006963D63|nr:replicative DNA helicase [Hymenobacter sp. AT01-02]